MTTPIEKAYEAAVAACRAAEEIWCDCGHDEESECEHKVAMEAAEDLEDAAMTALEKGIRTWDIFEAGCWYDEVVTSSKELALNFAKSNVTPDNYDVAATIWVEVRVRCELTGEEGSATVTINPREPKCSSEEGHKWTPHLERSNGGGVLTQETCPHCGCERTTDTWAQNPSNGQQGLRSVSYERLN